MLIFLTPPTMVYGSSDDHSLAGIALLAVLAVAGGIKLWHWLNK